MKIAAICTESSGFGCLDVLRKSHEITSFGVPNLQDDAIRQHLGYAEYSGVRLVRLTRTTLEQDLARWFGESNPDVLLVFGFPWRLPMGPLNQLRMGGFNIHYGTLPKFRGPQPVFWAVRERAAQIGVTIHRIDSDLDTGPVALRRSVPSVTSDTHGLAIARLGGPAADASMELIEKLERGTLSLEPQEPTGARYQPKPTDRELSIHWDREGAASIAALVRAANPYHGGALSHLRGNQLRIWQVATGALPGGAPPPGTIIAANTQQGLITVSRDGFWVRLDIVSIREGLFSGDEFATRLGIQPGEMLTNKP